MWWDPHARYNPNIAQEEWNALRSDDRVKSLASDIRDVIESGSVGVVDSSVLFEIAVDTKCRLGLPAPLIQMTGPWVSALVICTLIHAEFECDSPIHEEGKTRFSKSRMMNEPFTPENVMFVEDQWGHGIPTLKSEQRKVEEKQYELFEF